MTKKKNNFSWAYSGLAMALIAIIGFAMWWQLPINKLRADNISEYTITAELGSDQPASVSQKYDQRIAQFTLSTDSPDPVKLSALEFYALGNLKNKIVRKFNLAPLRVRLSDVILGVGDMWTYDYGSIKQLVHLEQPITIAKDSPAVIDVYVDLFYQHDMNFGVSLIGIDSPLLVEGIPLNAYIRKIKVF
ncbi:MAG: hypothetical protein V1807_03315 [Patescibacteria group bacterium]